MKMSTILPQGTAASTKNKLPSLITSMETIGAKALEDFADNIKVPQPLSLSPDPTCSLGSEDLSESKPSRESGLLCRKAPALLVS